MKNIIARFFIKNFNYSETSGEIARKFPHYRQGMVLILIWLFVTVALITMLFNGVRNNGQYPVQRYFFHILYVLTLLWYLFRSIPSANKLPEIAPFLLKRWKFGPFIPVLVLILLFALTLFSSEGVDNLVLLLMITTIWLIVVWRREIRLRPVILGFVLAFVAYFGGSPLLSNKYIGESFFILFLGFIPLMFIAGGILLNRAHFSESKLYDGSYRKAIWSFLRGCFLFVPLGLINAASGSPGVGISWVDNFWMPFLIPWFSGIAEEAVFRLVLITLIYYMLRPALNRFPALALFISILFSAIVFGLGHGGTLADRFITTGLLYGLPLSVIYVACDWEHAVGSHYMINLIPWMMTFLKY